MSTGLRDIVSTHIGQVALPLYEGIMGGFTGGYAAWVGLPGHEQHRFVLSPLTRMYARAYWEKEPLPIGWTIQGNPSLSGQILIVNEDLGLRLRLRKENRSVNPDGVPAAGATKAAQRAWGQLPLELDLPRVGTTAGEDPEGFVELLLLMDWDLDGKEPKVTARVVHTTDVGAYGARVAIDLSYDITPGGDLFKKLQFAGDEDFEDFFLDVRENDEGLDGTGDGR